MLRSSSPPPTSSSPGLPPQPSLEARSRLRPCSAPRRRPPVPRKTDESVQLGHEGLEARVVPDRVVVRIVVYPVTLPPAAPEALLQALQRFFLEAPPGVHARGVDERRRVIGGLGQGSRRPVEPLLALPFRDQDDGAEDQRPRIAGRQLQMPLDPAQRLPPTSGRLLEPA